MKKRTKSPLDFTEPAPTAAEELAVATGVADTRIKRLTRWSRQYPVDTSDWDWSAVAWASVADETTWWRLECEYLEALLARLKAKGPNYVREAVPSLRAIDPKREQP